MGSKLIIFLALVVVTFCPLFLLNDHVTPLTYNLNPSYLNKFQDRPIILCHRGSRYMGVENTLPMYKWALEMGCDVIEFDVRLTKDQVVIVYHDSSVNRTTNSVGYVRDFNYQDLMKLDPGYHYSPYNSTSQLLNEERFPFRGKGSKIPTLDEVLEKHSDNYMNIEIKDNDNILVEKLWNRLEKLGSKRLGNIIVASRWCEAISHFREISNNKVATSACEKEALYFFLSTKFGLHNILFSFIRPKAAVYQIPSVSSGIRFDEKKFVTAAHQLGQKIMYWVINNEEHMKDLFELGVDGVVSDRPDIAHTLEYKLGMVNKNKLSSIDKKYLNSAEGFFCSRNESL